MLRLALEFLADNNRNNHYVPVFPQEEKSFWQKENVRCPTS